MLKRVLICTCIVFSTVIFIQPNAHSEKYIVGGQTIAAPALLECMPVYVKESSIIPFCPETQHTGEKPADLLTLCVYGARVPHFHFMRTRTIITIMKREPSAISGSLTQNLINLNH